MYVVYPVPVAPVGGTGLANNGVAELLAVDEHRFLLLERSGSQDRAGAFRFYIRIYEADIDGADDVSGKLTLARATFVPRPNGWLWTSTN